ncbi:hypothetical protein KKF34_08075 [Myxococcota bacterium]|nr:hypothetical protein [Myxococcota bacterium]MBU1496818.1 hypothetical protein [Myxococcota bacterium]
MANYRKFIKYLLVCTTLVAMTSGCKPKTRGPEKDMSAQKGETKIDPFTGLEVMVETKADREFKLYAGPVPPPVPTEKMSDFPPPPDVSVKPNYGDVKVLRVHPKGEIQNMGAMTVTFNQPMIPLTSIEEQRALDLPVTIEPKIEGRFRWLGTQVLAFEPSMRFPYATQYRVNIPKGIKSAVGGVKKDDEFFTFTTPVVKILSFTPGYWGHHSTFIPIAMKFNQDVDPKHILSMATLTSSKGSVGLKLVPESEWKNYEKYTYFHSDKQKKRIVYFKPVRELDKNTYYTFTLKAGVKSLEGPLTTLSPIIHSFSTYPPLTISGIGCSWNFTPCRPGYSPRIQFSNQLKTSDKEIEKMLTVTPRVENLKMRVSYNSIYFYGDFKAAATYNVTLKPGMEDVWNQKYGTVFKGKIIMLDAYPSLTLPAYRYGVMEKTQNSTLIAQATNLTKDSTITLIKIDEENMFAAIDKIRNYYYSYYRPKAPSEGISGKKITYKAKINRRKNVNEEYRIDMRKVLGPNGGVVLAEIYSPDLLTHRWSDPYRYILLQVTDVGITVRYDLEKIVVMTNALTSGRPLANVDVDVYKRFYDSKARKYDSKKVFSGKTGKDGTVVSPGVLKDRIAGAHVVVAKSGKRDSAYVILEGYSQDGGYVSSYSWWGSHVPFQRNLTYQLFSDRNPYKAGETVEIAGILRMRSYGPKSEVVPVEGKDLKLKYRVRDPRGVEVYKGEATVDPEGMFRVTYKSKEGARLGYYNFSADLVGATNIDGYKSVYYGFQLLAYRAPEYTVEVKGPNGPYYFGDSMPNEISGQYTFGAPMNGSDMEWSLRRQRAWFAPPKHSGFTFGVPTWWGGWDYWGSYYNYSKVIKSAKGKLEANGKANVAVVLEQGKDKEKLPGAGHFTFEAQVYDVNRQSIAGRRSVTVHPASYYIGLKTPGGIVKENQNFKLEVVAADVDGNRVKGRDVKIRAVVTEWTRKMVKDGKYWRSKWESKTIEKGKCEIKTDVDPVSCTFNMKEGGSYTFEAVSKDEKGREAKSHAYIWIYGKKVKNWRQKNDRQFEILLDKNMYKPGDTAEIVLKSPFEKGYGIISFEREGLIEYRVVEMKGRSEIVKFKIEEYMIPNVHVSVVAIRGRINEKATENDADPGRPMFATGSMNMNISSESRKLNVVIVPSRPVIKPGEEVEVEVQTTDYQGKPVETRVALAVVDEGVLSLLGYSLPNPLHVFNPWLSRGTAMNDIRINLLKDPKKKLLQAPPAPPVESYMSKNGVVDTKSISMSARGGAGAKADSPAKRVLISDSVKEEAKDADKGPSGSSVGGKKLSFKIRKLFASTAYFNTKLYTDASGKVKVKIKMPENLTSYRFMAMAMEKDAKPRYGRGDEKVSIRRKFMIRPSLPRFANYGDTFEASVVVNNMTGKTGEATVKIEGVGFELLETNMKTVNVENGKPAEVYFKVKTLWPGQARFRFSGFIGEETDSVEPAPIKVNVPSTSEATATYGVTETAIAQPIKPPANIMKNFGGLDIHLSSTALTGLQDAVVKLVEHHYENAESYASKLIPLINLQDILSSFKIAKLGDLAQQKALGQIFVNKLINHQNYEGGFSYWPGHWYVSPYVSMYATWVLYMAKKQGYVVPDEVLSRASRYIMYILMNDYYMRSYRTYYYYAWTTKFFGYWVLTQLKNEKWVDNYYASDEKIKSYTKDFFSHRDKVGLFAKAWLMTSIYRMHGNNHEVRELMRVIQNAGVESARGVHFAESTAEDLKLLMHSNSMTDSIVMRALMEVTPNDVQIPKIMKALMEARIRGSWESSLANSFALEAVSYYYRKYENVTPNYKAMVWLGKGYIGSKEYKGRSMAITHKRIPMDYVAKQGTSNLILAKKGEGKLYYRLGLTYVPTNLKLKPEDQGFYVMRKYEAVQDKNDVVKNADGSWTVKAGKYVRVRLTVVVSDRKYYAAIDDPFPAGFEGVDMQLRTSASSTLMDNEKNNGRSMGYYWSWYWSPSPDHKEMKDDRYVLFYDRLPAGVYEHSYVVRATTVGEFIVPPLKAHEMYAPESFGRNGTEIVKVVR